MQLVYPQQPTTQRSSSLPASPEPLIPVPTPPIIQSSSVLSSNPPQPSLPASPPSVVAAIIPITASPWSWFSYATHQGIEHVLTLPLMVLIVVGIRANFPFITEHRQRKYLISLFLLAMIPLTIIHLGEFTIESQKWLPLENIIEQMETVLYLSTIGLFAFALYRSPKLLSENQSMAHV